MADPRVSDTSRHCIYIQAPFTDQEAKEYLDEVLYRGIQKYPKLAQIPVSLTIKMGVTKNSNPTGYGFIWCSQPTVASALCGLNLDGTERIQETPDPEWSGMTPETLLELQQELKQEIESSASTPELKLLETKLGIVEQILQTGQIPMIRTLLPNILDLHSVECDEFQMEVMRTLYDHLGDRTQVVIPEDTYTPVLKIAHAYPARQGYHPNQLIAFISDKPSWVTPAKIHQQVDKFRTSSIPVKVTILGKDRQRVLITFDPKTNDAVFARLFLKDLELTDGDQCYPLSFGFAKVNPPRRN